MKSDEIKSDCAYKTQQKKSYGINLSSLIFFSKIL